MNINNFETIIITTLVKEYVVFVFKKNSIVASSNFQILQRSKPDDTKVIETNE